MEEFSYRGYLIEDRYNYRQLRGSPASLTCTLTRR
jgi:hypothetical protein